MKAGISKWLWIGGAAIIMIVMGVILWSSISAQGEIKPGVDIPTVSLVEISPSEAYQKYTQGAFFLDVRSKAEWEQGHVAGSILIPLDELSSRLYELPGDREIVVVCLSGRRSMNGTEMLLKAGFDKVFCLTGGLQAWSEAGYPLEVGSP